MTRLSHLIALACLLLALPAFAALSQEGRTQEQATEEAEAGPTQAELDEAVVVAQKPFYPLSVCVVSGEALDSKSGPIDLVVDGQLVRVCCQGCTRSAKANAAEHVAGIQAAAIEAQKASYPIQTCSVSGEELGSMGEPIDVLHNLRLVRLCCNGCARGFQRKPEETMKQLDAAYIEAQIPDYPLKACVVSGEPLDEGSEMDVLYGNQLIRLCCGGCKRKFQQAPSDMFAKYQAAVALQAEAGAENNRLTEELEKLSFTPGPGAELR